MSSSSDDELEFLRQQRRLQLQQEIQQQAITREQEEFTQQSQIEAKEKIDAFLKIHLTSEAKTRLTQLSLAKPEKTEELKLKLVDLIQKGSLTTPVDDAQFKSLLESLSKSRRTTSIRRI